MRKAGLLLILLMVLPASGSTTLYDIEVQSTTGMVSLRKYLEQPVLIMAMTSACGSCKLQNDYLKQIYDASDEVTILSVAIDKEIDNMETLKNYKDSQAIPWEILLDISSEFSLTYHINEYPNMMLFDTNGDLVKSWRGVTSSQTIASDLDDYIDITLQPDEENPLLNDLLSNPGFIGFLGLLSIATLGLLIVRVKQITKN